jgi:hypothetical protein
MKVLLKYHPRRITIASSLLALAGYGEAIFKDSP